MFVPRLGVTAVSPARRPSAFWCSRARHLCAMEKKKNSALGADFCDVCRRRLQAARDACRIQPGINSQKERRLHCRASPQRTVVQNKRDHISLDGFATNIAAADAAAVTHIVKPTAVYPCSKKHTFIDVPV